LSAKTETPKNALVRLEDLVQESRPITVAPGKELMVRALGLREMVQVLVAHTEDFMSLYSAGVGFKVGDDAANVEMLAPFLLACPDLVATVIAYATDAPDKVEIAKTLPATVQLIALAEVWRLTVPDAKKMQELLSVVMALLQKLGEKQKRAEKATQTA
jgi:hypothetical protein